MSNIKAVEIEGRVPFDWLNAGFNSAFEDDSKRLADEDVAFLARLFLSPSGGLSLSYRSDGYDANERGGKTHMNIVSIVGHEALSYNALSRIVECIATAGTVTQARAADIENHSGWGRIPTREELEASQRAAEVRVAQLMKGKHWVTVGNTSRLEAD